MTAQNSYCPVKELTCLGVSALSFAATSSGSIGVASARRGPQNHSMIDLFLLVARGLALTCRGHHELVIEKLAGC